MTHQRPAKPEPRASARDIAMIYHQRALREAHWRWSSGELLALGITRQQFEQDIRALEKDFDAKYPPETPTP